MLHGIIINATAVVCERDDDLIASDSRLNGNCAALFNSVCGVGQEIEKDLVQLPGETKDLGQIAKLR